MAGLALVGTASAGAGGATGVSPPTPPPRSDAAAAPGPATGPLSKLPVARVEAIEVVVANEIARLGIPGLSLAIGHEGEIDD